MFTIILFASCKSKEKVDFGYDYFPMQEGHFVIYNVMEVFHDVNLSPQHDTLRYKLRTEIGEIIIDNSGRQARKYIQSKYHPINDSLLEKRVWTRIIDEGRGEVVEENQRKIRLTFAVKKDRQWDVNAFNILPQNIVHIEDVDKERRFDNLEFESTSKISYEDFFSLVDYRMKYEVYAKGVGLVKRSFKDLSIQNFDTLDIVQGTEIHYDVIQFGN
ncbi:hypothetical protein CW751_12080 [Brumimicrobium salinarum]|uniref:Uncharacterized protein n=1 Tax=Brumimicrobium salinarum TaxID=2058658 RepID=A0A2I0R0P2_9FLAO|nr:hypothetical protein CW751_12080 [Brumimicrobium salinarum]